MWYLDHGATSYPKPPEVTREVERCLTEAGVNPGRGAYQMAAQADAWVGRARRALAALFGCDDPQRVIFAMSCTDALNMALKGLLQRGDRVIATQMAHNAVARPLHHLEATLGLDVVWLAPDPNGFVTSAQVEAALDAAPTKMVVLEHASNVVGSLLSLEDIGPIVRQYGALLLVDAAQSAGVVPIDMQRHQIDLLAWPGHKGLYGHMGIGGLCVGPRATAIRPWREGGTGTDSLSLQQPTTWPARLEAGTHNLLGIASLLGGLAYLERHPPGAILRHHQALRQQLTAGLDALEIPYLGHGPADQYVGTVSCWLPGHPSQIISSTLDANFQIATRAGLHCAPLAHKAMGTTPDGTVRISMGCSTTTDEMVTILNALEQIKEYM